MPRRTRVALALVACFAAGCTSDPPAAAPAPTFSGPAVETFTPGTCAMIAPDVLGVGKGAFDLGAGPSASPEVQQRLIDSQARLREQLPSAAPEVAGPLGRLVQGIGLVRIRAIGASLDEDVLQTLTDRYDAVLEVCAAPAAAPSSSPTA